jgi:hypothetical protein
MKLLDQCGTVRPCREDPGIQKLFGTRAISAKEIAALKLRN